jgi:thiamine kinase-like enzyme
VLAWLREIATIDRGPASNAESCLQALARCPYPSLRAAANDVLDRKGGNNIVLTATVMHGDLTLGNVMLDPSRSRDFMIIDWGGSSVDGFPIFDLVKFAEAVRLPTRRLRAEIAAHAGILGCAIQDTRSYLTAALGHIWLNLEQFPPERFAAMAERNLNTLDGALNG